jgi:bifunctional non-homologous end joining protein LigD
MNEMPRLIRPMLAKLERQIPADDDRYGWEYKWDGLRAVAYIEGGRLRLISRNDKDMTSSYPELGELTARTSGSLILDGEIVTLRHGRPDFSRLQSRMHVLDPSPALVKDTPVQINVFDVLYQQDRVLLDVPYTERRDRLASLALDDAAVRVPPWFRGDASTVLADSLAQGLEGVVGKPLTSPYQPDLRGWIKVKNVRQQEVIICGWTEGEGNRAGTIGSLLLGIHDDQGVLVYAGHVGTGFNAGMLAELTEQLRPLARAASPFATPVPARYSHGVVHWTEPQLAGEVAFAEWTREGILRQPTWRGFRPDKSAADVHRED